MSRGPDAATLLERALCLSARQAGFALSIRTADWRRWASATFVGARHELVLEMAGDARTRRWLDGLGDADLPIRGHLVADVAIVDERIEGDLRVVSVEALTVEER